MKITIRLDILILLFVLNLIPIFFWLRHVRKELTKQIKGVINEVVKKRKE